MQLKCIFAIFQLFPILVSARYKLVRWISNTAYCKEAVSQGNIKIKNIFECYLSTINVYLTMTFKQFTGTSLTLSIWHAKYSNRLVHIKSCNFCSQMKVLTTKPNMRKKISAMQFKYSIIIPPCHRNNMFPGFTIYIWDKN